jgi:hypothetical protein
VGYYYDGHATHGFLLDANGSFTTLDFPGASPTRTLRFAINDAGEIVGYYWHVNGMNHAFIATPVPEPSSIALLDVGAAALVAWRRVRRDRSQKSGPASPPAVSSSWPSSRGP